MNDKFEKALSLNVNDKVEKKNGLSYLSWSFAWSEFCKIYPGATYKIIKDDNRNCAFGDKERGYMVYTEVTADGITHEMWLPVMDFKNKSMLNPTTFDINKTVMRCLTKNLAMFGIGLYIYSGEDVPEEVKTEKVTEEPKTTEEIKISAAQQNRMFAIGKGKETEIRNIMKKFGYEKSADILKKDYNEIVAEIEKIKGV